MKITISLDYPERAYRQSFEAELPEGGGKELFAALCHVVTEFEQRRAMNEVFKELNAMSSEEFKMNLRGGFCQTCNASLDNGRAGVFCPNCD